jgi:hypothetical protein
MSGVLKSLGKIFKAVVVKPIKFAVKMDHKVAMKVWHTPILRYIAIAVAVYFTAGAAMAYFGAAGAAGGTAAAGAAAGAGTAAGATAVGTAGVAGGASLAAGGTAFASGAAVAGTTAAVGTGAAVAGGVTTLGAVTVTASTAGVAAAGLSAGTIAAVSVGTAVTAAAAMNAGHVADNAVTQGQGTVTGTPGVTDLQGVTVTGNIPPAADNSLFASTFSGDMALDSSFAVADIAQSIKPETNPVGRTDPTKNPDGSPKSITQRTTDYLKQKVGMNTNTAQYDENGALITPEDAGAAPGAVAGAAPKAGMSSFEKIMLLKSGVDLASGLLQKPQPQMQYSGVNKNGEGQTLGMHTINGGYGLAVGGHEPAPLGVNPALMAPGGVAGQQGAAQQGGAGGAGGTAGVSGLTGAHYTAGIGGSPAPAAPAPSPAFIPGGAA